MRRRFILILITGLLIACGADDESRLLEEEEHPELGAAKVQTVKVNGKWRLYRNGEPFYFRGAAAGASTYSGSNPDYYYGMLADFGGNAIRTYSVNEYSLDILDAAHANGLAVCFGLWVNRETDGFDYNDEARVQQQLEDLRQAVLQFKRPSCFIDVGDRQRSRCFLYQPEIMGCNK